MRIVTRCSLVALGLVAVLDAHAFEITPGGRLHLDYARHDADAKLMEDGFLVRRASFGLDGKFNDAWTFEFGYDVVDGGEFKDVSLEYDGWKQGAFTFGQFKVPFGLEELTSSNNISLIERALPTATFAPSRRMGVGFHRNRDNTTLAVMGFGDSIDGDEGHGVGVRFTLAPVNSGDLLVHLGAAATTERPRGEIKFNARPESRVADVKLVNTGALDNATRIDQLGLEAAWKSGPLSVQGEWMRSKVSRDAGSPDVRLDGWYVAGSWLLTEQSRTYKNGAFKGISTIGKHGAWELVARYSHVDLDDGQVRGGEENNFTLGMNYYASKHLRLMANYIDVHSRRKDKADNPDILLLRAQVVF